MTGAGYPAAKAVAGRIQPHFARDLAAARALGQNPVAPEPDAGSIEAIIDAAFWASLRREEGRETTVSIAFLPPEAAERPLRFEVPLPLTPDMLTRLAPAVERPGIHLGVWRDCGQLSVWGTTRTIPTFCFVLEVIAPGLLVVKHRRGEEAGKFVNVAVLEGDRIKVLDQNAARLPDCPNLLISLLGFNLESRSSSVSVLVQLAVSMRKHGHGGSLLVVPANTDTWRESIVQPVRYSVSPPFSELADLMKEDPGERDRRWQEALRRAVDATAGLTSVDGATVITDEYDLLAFGAKIRRRWMWTEVEQVVLTEPIEGTEALVVHPTQLGGTRHLSAAQFSHDQQEAIALVASQDGRFTIFAWSSCEEMVYAHRIETLLL
jgi:hypothetical protein